MAATKLVLPGELGKHAVQEGSKALAKMKWVCVIYYLHFT
jgi:hypothetical protein